VNSLNAALGFAKAVDAYRKDEATAQDLVEAYEVLIGWIDERSIDDEPEELTKRRVEYMDRKRLQAIEPSDAEPLSYLRRLAAHRYAKAIEEAVRA
jgi:hypothetical protein